MDGETQEKPAERVSGVLGRYLAAIAGRPKLTREQELARKRLPHERHFLRLAGAPEDLQGEARSEAIRQGRDAAMARKRSTGAGPKRLHSRRLRQACPAWADTDAITAIYAEAQRITRETGEPHEVDHVIPLLGRNVSGLHVEYNLAILPRKANRQKCNR